MKIKKTFNYTNKVTISKNDTIVRLHGDINNKPVADFEIDLRRYKFPEESNVRIKCRHQTRKWERVIKLNDAVIKIHAVDLAEFDDAKGIKCSVAVANPDTGLLLGVAKNIKLHHKGSCTDERHSPSPILDMRSADLKNIGPFYYVKFGQNDAILEIEKKLGDIDSVVKMPIFQTIMLPAAVREILHYFFVDQNWDGDLSDTESFTTRWMILAQQLGLDVLEESNSKAARYQWITDVVQRLTVRIDARESAIEKFSRGRLI